MKERRLTPGLLLLSVCILLLLFPGGPVDKRVFPDLPLLAAVSVNLHAVILGTCAAFSVVHTRRGGRLALYLAALEAVNFAAIYLADLGEALSSTTAMGAVMKVLNIVGFAAAVLLLASVTRDLRRPVPEVESPYGASRGEIVSLIAFSVYVGVILTFTATISTVSRYPGFYLWYGTR
jgi:hypothetical protein